MLVSLEKAMAHYGTALFSRRGRVFLALAFATVFFMIFLQKSAAYDFRKLKTIYDDDSGSITVNTQEATRLEENSGQASDASKDGKKSAGSGSNGDVDWSRFAYTQYVTNSEYLCNSIMVFERLHQLGSRADRLMMYPASMLWDPTAKDGGGSHDADLLIKARDEYNVKLVQIKVQHKETDEETWADSYTKLLAFNQTQYDRVISIDSDMTVLQHMDELFFMPPCPVAMPRAYWLLDDKPPKKILSSHVMLIQPSEKEFMRIVNEIEAAGQNEYDMEILNKLYLDSALVLPHRPYSMLTSEFRMKDHHRYLGSKSEEWDPIAIYNETRTVHFSDYPVPKPWVEELDEEALEHIEKMQPDCKTKADGQEDCTERKIWRGFYDDFRKRKGLLCAEKPRPKLEDVPSIPVN